MLAAGIHMNRYHFGFSPECYRGSWDTVPKEMPQVPTVMRSRAPLIQCRDDLGDQIVGDAPGSMRYREVLKHVTQCRRELGILAFEPAKVRGQQIAADGFVAQHEAIVGTVAFADGTELADVVQQVCQPRNMWRPLVVR